MIFDNGLERSRILEIEPPNGDILWAYREDDFFSYWGGSNQRLPNGNTLVTETAKGRAFEITPDGDIVWEFANPEILGNGERVNIWRMTRIEAASSEF